MYSIINNSYVFQRSVINAAVISIEVKINNDI